MKGFLARWKQKRQKPEGIKFPDHPGWIAPLIIIGFLSGSPTTWAQPTLPQFPFPEGWRKVLSTSEPYSRLPLISERVGPAWQPSHYLEGAATREVWQSNQTSLTTGQLHRRISSALIAMGYEIQFVCQKEHCGGFDFRLALPITPPPEMFFNVGDFWYCVAYHQSDQSWITLLNSRSGERLYAEITKIEGNIDIGQTVAALRTQPIQEEQNRTEIKEPEPSFERHLIDQGRAVLEGVRFLSGQTTLTDSGQESLSKLAKFLQSHASSRIAIVGHTDITGTSEGNQRISLARARAVRNVLVNDHEIASHRIETYGAGFIAPLSHNLDPENRAQNRRVEAVLLALDPPASE